MSEPISWSLFDLFKVGPGPSSSHTIGPMRAGYEALGDMRRLSAADRARADRIEVRLFGSLSATGRGHGTDRAVLAGLMGHDPAACPPGLLAGLLQEPGRSYPVCLGDRTLTMAAADIVFDRIEGMLPHPCTLAIRLLAGAAPLVEREYYSVGGGFIQWNGWQAPARGRPAYPYATAADVRALLARHAIPLHALLLANECAVSGLGEPAVCGRLDAILAAMEAAVARGISTEGFLPGPLRVHRKAPGLARRAARLSRTPDHFMALLAAYAFAAAEENAAGQPVVTAPTCGAAGVVPAVLRVMREELGVTPDRLRQGLMAAGLVGLLAKRNATLAGAEAGCQAEIGVASAMAAAMLAYAQEADARVMENAAEIALEHHLGMTCDPVGGYVQIPCIERNAMGAVKAYLAWLIAREETADAHRVDLDQAILVMGETGRDLQAKYRETAAGGLAKYVH